MADLANGDGFAALKPILCIHVASEVIMRIWLIGLLLVLSGAAAQAVCVCRCVEGEPRAICDSRYDGRPSCPQNVCPLVLPSRPVDTHPAQPIGRPDCSQQQVLNPRTRQYEWRRVCE
jgi:hypothetical protein